MLQTTQTEPAAIARRPDTAGPLAVATPTTRKLADASISVNTRRAYLCALAKSCWPVTGARRAWSPTTARVRRPPAGPSPSICRQRIRQRSGKGFAGVAERGRTSTQYQSTITEENFMRIFKTRRRTPGDEGEDTPFFKER